VTIDTQSFSTRRRTNSLGVDRIDGVDYQIVKMAYGDEDEVILVSEDNPLPGSGGGGGAGGTEYEEDTPHVSGSDGTMVLAVRRDADTSLVSADGDMAPLQVDADGNLKVNVVVGGGSIGAEVELGATTLAALESITVVDGGSTISVDDGAGSLTVDGTVAATQSGTWNIGSITTLPTLAAVTTVSTVTNVATIGTSVTPGTGAAHLGKAEDAAHASGDTGVMALAVRRDADTTLAGTDGDYAPLQVNSSGSLKVAITAGAGSGGTSIADGASFTRDTTSITPVGAVVETSAPTLTNGDVAGLSQTTGGALRVAVASGGIAGLVEDAASAGGEEGVGLIVVRRDTPSSGVSADGDFAMLSCNSSGALYVTGGGGGTQYAIDAVAGAADTGTLALAVRDDVLATVTPADGDYTQLRTNARGAQWVALDSTAAQTVTLAAGTATNEIVGDVAQDDAVAGNPVLIGLRASTATPTAMSANGDSVYAWATLNGAQVVAGEVVDDAAFSVASTRVSPAGYFADETATDSVDEGDIGAARITLDRKQIVTNYAHAAGGHSSFKSLDLDESEEEVKATAGTLYWIHVMNMSASVRYLKIYNNTAAGTTVGTTTPVHTFPIPTLANTNGAGFTLSFGGTGLALGTGITVAATTGLADNDTGAPGANEVVFNCGYI
jgi:hypothetical protein